MCGRSRPAAGAAANLIKAAIDGAILNRRPAAIALAMRLAEFAVHVHKPLRAGPLVQVVHILRAEKEAVAELPFQLSQSHVRRIRLGLCARRPPRRVELPDPPGIRSQASGVQTSSTRLPAQSPSEARKVGSPLSALMPAPVRTKTWSLLAIEIFLMVFPWSVVSCQFQFR